MLTTALGGQRGFSHFTQEELRLSDLPSKWWGQEPNTENPKTLNSTNLNVVASLYYLSRKKKGPKHTESSRLRQINQVKERVLTENA